MHRRCSYNIYEICSTATKLHVQILFATHLINYSLILKVCFEKLILLEHRNVYRKQIHMIIKTRDEKIKLNSFLSSLSLCWDKFEQIINVHSRCFDVNDF